MNPETIGSYRVLEKVGAGGMGTVYRAEHSDTGRVAAVKVLPAALAREEGFRPRFEREIEALEKLQSPHIVELFDYNISDDGEDDAIWYAMEFVEGETVTARLHRENKIPWEETVELALQLCQALKAAHNTGVVHRDLKPSNLLITPEGVLKLTDFGIAQVFAAARLTQTGGVIGTAEYMSPEQVKGARATKKSDLYSLGVVMYAMLTGRPPFSGQSAADVMQKHLYARFDRPSRAVDIPVWLDDVVCELLEKDPDERPPDALVVFNRLQEVKKRVAMSLEADTSAEGSLGDEHVAIGEQRANPEPGGATMMRDLLRGELQRQQQGGLVSRFFNNTFVLIVLLVLVVWGGVMWFSRGQSLEERFQEAADVIDNHKESPAWIEARDDGLLAIMEEINDDENVSNKERISWSNRIAPYLKKVRLYEFKRQLGLAKLRKKESIAPENEPERLLIQARRLIELGEDAAAADLLSNLQRVVAGVSEHSVYFAMAEEMRKQIGARKNPEQREEFVKAGIARAHAYHKQNLRDQAIAVLDSLEKLYGRDPELSPRIAEARTEITAPKPSPKG